MHKVCAETLSSVSVRRRYDGADCVSFTLIFLFNENTISHSFISRGFSFPNRPPGFKSALETKISKLKPPDRKSLKSFDFGDFSYFFGRNGVGQNVGQLPDPHRDPHVEMCGKV